MINKQTFIIYGLKTGKKQNTTIQICVWACEFLCDIY